ncbi:hypothetical protein SCHPADRAFT_916732 [Schizopora paradoxa]|uniref:DUF202 domain-containing protein n=1 Tax=Schizopora paradoxa TaxID=27342 RepID=A0A0H2RWL5_9AGAM|nr:hypothetical protein SCHPADRAFT_916732 [Schizopora paradoxa]
MTSRQSPYVRGHRANSFVPLDITELVEIRARQRTFGGAYARTALGNLGYSILFLKLFDRRFYKIGLLYALLAAFLLVIATIRAKHNKHDFADHPDEDYSRAIQTKGQSNARIFGRPFVTAGRIAVAIVIGVGIIEMTLFVLVLKL